MIQGNSPVVAGKAFKASHTAGLIVVATSLSTKSSRSAVPVNTPKAPHMAGQHAVVIIRTTLGRVYVAVESLFQGKARTFQRAVVF